MIQSFNYLYFEVLKRENNFTMNLFIYENHKYLYTLVSRNQCDRIDLFLYVAKICTRAKKQ